MPSPFKVFGRKRDKKSEDDGAEGTLHSTARQPLSDYFQTSPAANDLDNYTQTPLGNRSESDLRPPSPFLTPRPRPPRPPRPWGIRNPFSMTARRIDRRSPRSPLLTPQPPRPRNIFNIFTNSARNERVAPRTIPSHPYLTPQHARSEQFRGIFSPHPVATPLRFGLPRGSTRSSPRVPRQAPPDDPYIDPADIGAGCKWPTASDSPYLPANQAFGLGLLRETGENPSPLRNNPRGMRDDDGIVFRARACRRRSRSMTDLALLNQPHARAQPYFTGSPSSSYAQNRMGQNVEGFWPDQPPVSSRAGAHQAPFASPQHPDDEELSLDRPNPRSFRTGARPQPFETDYGEEASDSPLDRLQTAYHDNSRLSPLGINRDRYSPGPQSNRFHVGASLRNQARPSEPETFPNSPSRERSVGGLRISPFSPPHTPGQATGPNSPHIRGQAMPYADVRGQSASLYSPHGRGQAMPYADVRGQAMPYTDVRGQPLPYADIRNGGYDAENPLDYPLRHGPSGVGNNSGLFRTPPERLESTNEARQIGGSAIQRRSETPPGLFRRRPFVFNTGSPAGTPREPGENDGRPNRLFQDSGLGIHNPLADDTTRDDENDWQTEESTEESSRRGMHPRFFQAYNVLHESNGGRNVLPPENYPTRRNSLSMFRSDALFPSEKIPLGD